MLTLLWRHRGYTGLRFFWNRDSHSPPPLVERKIQSGNLFSLKFRWIPKDADLCFSLKFFQVRKLELYPGHGTICWKLCSSKVENSEEKTRRLRIGSSAEFLYSMTCVVICSHRRSPLSHFYRVSYRYFWRRDSKRWRQTSNKANIWGRR